MKLIKSLFVFIVIVIIPMFVFSQVGTPDTTGLDNLPPKLGEDPGLTDLVDYYNVLYGALVILFGYVAKAFGLKKKVPNFIVVIIAGGVVIAAGFIALGFSNFFPLLFSFLGSIGFFEIFMKPIERATGFRVKKSDQRS